MKKEKTGSKTKWGLKLNIYTITLIALFLVFVFGGGIEDKSGRWSIKTEGLRGFLKEMRERSTSDDAIEKYRDSTTIKDPDKLLRVIKQHLENKDNQK